MTEETQLPAGAEEIGGDAPTADQTKTSQFESEYYSVISQTTADGRIMIGQDIQIFPDRECKHLASPGTKAFETKDRRAAGEQFTLLCGRSSLPRVMLVGSYKNLRNPHILQLVDAGIINWTPENQQRFALIFEKPSGKKVLGSPEAQPLMLPEDRLVQALIQPAVSVLSNLQSMGSAHGAIRLENLFLVGHDGLETIMLGECLSSAASSWQPPLYEIAPRAAVKPPVGRGPGTIKDDLYALGVCAVMMARGKNVMMNKSHQQLVYDKIEQGSYSAIIGEERVPTGLAEFLRGVLNDDEGQRWDIDDATRWLEGRRQTPKQARIVLKAARPLSFNGQKYWDLKSLAESFSEKIPEAVLEIEKGQFVSWLKRNFEDKTLKQRFDKIWEQEKTWPREKVVSCVCMALDPFGPVRFKGLATFPDGLGTALAVAISNNQDVQIYAEMILQQLFSTWLSQSLDEVPDGATLMSSLEKCRSALTQKMPGYGMERVLYMLNPEVTCLSPVLKNYFVLSLSSAGFTRDWYRGSVIGLYQ
ncbi:MAG: protein kinase family protein [Proteobacteria bacterium]|nr:protein kinase family protein [Pseudomonadota bacterium]